jgi:alpha-D-ribose 1-methylphosphonate 5-triphosphate synthase subunit PhnI
MAYVAARGGEAAILEAERLYRESLGTLTLERVRLLEETMPYLLDRVMGEASLYAPELAALAIAQTGGDLYEAVLLLRAYRSTQPRLAYAAPLEPEDVPTVRRVSAAFKDIPGGQVLGPTLDYSHRLLRMDVLRGEAAVSDQPRAQANPLQSDPSNFNPSSFPALAAWQRKAGLLPEIDQDMTTPEEIPDVTREPMLFPVSRAHKLQSLARADTGGVLALGYANMRGYGSVHPTINEVRLGHGAVVLTHPGTGANFSAGEVRVSSSEIVTNFAGDPKDPRLQLGFSATLGWNEVKVIAASMLDLSMERSGHPSQTAEFVLYHTEPVEASGFCIHFKLPHYVTFQSSLEAMRDVKRKAEQARSEQTHSEQSQATPDTTLEEVKS